MVATARIAAAWRPAGSAIGCVRRSRRLTASIVQGSGTCPPKALGDPGPIWYAVHSTHASLPLERHLDRFWRFCEAHGHYHHTWRTQTQTMKRRLTRVYRSRSHLAVRAAMRATNDPAAARAFARQQPRNDTLLQLKLQCLPFLQILPTAALPFSSSGFATWIPQTVYCYFWAYLFSTF